MPIDNSYITPGIGRVFYSHRKPYFLKKIDVSPESLNLYNDFLSLEIKDNDHIKKWLSDNMMNRFKKYNDFLNVDIKDEIKKGFLRLQPYDRKRFLYLLAKNYNLF